MMTNVGPNPQGSKVLIVGGGPAGSLAAILLARQGIEVTLVEQHRFPRDKVCGECLSALGREVLQRHNLDGSISRVGRELTMAHLFGRSTQAEVPLPSPMMGISRSLMDQALLSAAADSGVEIKQPARVEALDPADNSVQTRVRHLNSNQSEVVQSEVVFVADGRGVWLGRRPHASTDLGLKAHFHDVSADPAAITLYGGIGCYGGVAPIEVDRWNVAFSIPRRAVGAAKGNLQHVWDTLMQRSPAIARHFQSATRATDWLAAPLPRHRVVGNWHPRVIPIGAAACALEPVGGEGMGTALRSAELAVEALLSGRLAQLPGEYELLWNRRSLFCRLGGVALADGMWSDSLALVRHPVVALAAMKLIGK